MKDLTVKDSKNLSQSLDKVFEQLYELSKRMAESYIRDEEYPYSEANQENWALQFNSWLDGGFFKLEEVVRTLQSNGILNGYRIPQELLDKIAIIDKEARANVEIGIFIAFVQNDMKKIKNNWVGAESLIKIEDALIESYKNEEARMKSSDNVA